MELFNVYPLMDVEPVSAKGSWITDKTGLKYLDLYGGHAVISVGHSHPDYIAKISKQLSRIGFYSNSIQNPSQVELADKLGKMSGLPDYQLFLCNSGAESNEAALKLASYHTGKEGVIAFSDGFHGRTAGVSAVTASTAIKIPSKKPDNVHFAEFNNIEQVKEFFLKEEVGAVILECIQGIGGVNLVTKEFYKELLDLCKKYNALLIADEVQSGFGRTGKFFSFQHLSSEYQPDLISMAKGMGNGFPVGGVLISPEIKPVYGLLGSTFGGNYIACNAVLAVLDIIENESLLENSGAIGDYLLNKVSGLPELKEVRGKGLMIGLEFHNPVADIRKELVRKYQILTGSSSNPNVLRILPSLTVSIEEVDLLLSALQRILKERESNEAVHIS